MMINQPIKAIALLALAASSLLLACGEEEVTGPPPTFDFPLEVIATDRDEAPVPGVPVLVDDNLVGFTDAGGVFRATINENQGATVRLATQAPEGFTIISADRELESQLRLTQGMDGQPRGVPTTLRVQLQSIVYEYFAWVQVDCDSKIDDDHCKGLPVLLDGEEFARTDEQGLAHFSFEGLPSTTHELSLATPEPGEDKPTFQPANPTYEIELGADPVIYHIAESFTDPTVQDRPRRRRTRRPARTRPAPQQEQPQQQQQEEDEDTGVICLFGDC